MGPLGGNKGEEFNDVGFEGMKNITVGADDANITNIKTEYVKNGKVEIREHGAARGELFFLVGAARGELKEFSVDYLRDSITAVGGTYKHIYSYDTTLIPSMYFTTSKRFTSPLFGEMKGTEFEFKGENGEKLIGFHGRSGDAIDAIRAYFGSNSNSGSGSNMLLILKNLTHKVAREAINGMMEVIMTV